MTEKRQCKVIPELINYQLLSQKHNDWTQVRVAQIVVQYRKNEIKSKKHTD